MNLEDLWGEPEPPERARARRPSDPQLAAPRPLRPRRARSTLPDASRAELPARAPTTGAGRRATDRDDRACSPPTTSTSSTRARHSRLVREARRAPADGRRRRGHHVRRVGAERRGGLGDRRLQRLGRAAPPARAASATPASGRASCRASATATLYKYHVALAQRRLPRRQGRPVRAPRRGAAAHRARVVWDLAYDWGDDDVDGRTRRQRNALDAPISIYEVHLGSWRRAPDDGDRLARLPRARRRARRATCTRLGFTHVELLPVMEHPFYGSWGYQTTGYFAPTSRYGTPQDFMYLIDQLHQRGHRRDPRLGAVALPDRRARPRATSTARTCTSTPTRARASTPTGTASIFNYGRNEVRSFLLSSALLLARRATTSTACASTPSPRCSTSTTRARRASGSRTSYGGRENLEAIDFLRAAERGRLRRRIPDVQTYRRGVDGVADGVAADRTSAGSASASSGTWAGCTTRSQYFAHDPVHRRYHHDELTFRALYAFTENFVLPLSHDEVVHGKGSLLAQDARRRLAAVRQPAPAASATCTRSRARSCCSWAASSASGDEWNHETSLDWHLLDDAAARAASSAGWPTSTACTASEPALHELDCRPGRLRVGRRERPRGQRASASCAAAASGDAAPRASFNFTPVPRSSYRDRRAARRAAGASS